MAVRLPDWRLKSGGFNSGSSGGGIPFREKPIGTIDGSNKVFTTSFNPWLGYVWLKLNGDDQDPINGPEFTVSGNTITYAVAPRSTDKHWCWYFRGPGSPTLTTLRARLFSVLTDSIDWGALNGSPCRLVGDMSLGIWIKPQSDTQGCLIRTGAGGGLSATTAWPYFMSLKGSSGNWSVIVGHDTAGSNINNGGSPFAAALANNVWVYLGFTRDATAKTYTLYKGDGISISTVGVFSYSDNPDPLAGTDSAAHLTISSADYRSDLGIVHYVGTMEEHYIWSRKLTSAEHATAMAGVPPKTGLVLSCPMGSTPEVDISSSSLIGTVTGTTVVQGH